MKNKKKISIGGFVAVAIVLMFFAQSTVAMAPQQAGEVQNEQKEQLDIEDDDCIGYGYINVWCIEIMGLHHEFPLGGVIVTLYGPVIRTKISNYAWGSCSFYLLPFGQYSVHGWKPGYISDTKSVTLSTSNPFASVILVLEDEDDGGGSSFDSIQIEQISSEQNSEMTNQPIWS